MTCGVSQDSILGPTLFSLYGNDKGWKYRLEIDNRYRYSLLFGYRMQKFFTF